MYNILGRGAALQLVFLEQPLKKARYSFGWQWKCAIAAGELPLARSEEEGWETISMPVLLRGVFRNFIGADAV